MSLAAFLGVLTLLIVFAGTIISGMRLYAGLAERIARLEAKHNGGAPHREE